MENDNMRKFVLQALFRVNQKGAYSNLALDSIIKKHKLTGRDKDFVTRLFLGVLERRLTLDYVLEMYSNRPLSKLSPTVLDAMRMGLYELVFMNTDHFAAVYETTELVKRSRNAKAAGLVNAVLRAFLRAGGKICWPQREENTVKYFSVCYSCPCWLVESLIADYGEEHAERFLKHQFGSPPLTVRVNTRKTSDAALLDLFKEENINAQPTPLPHCIDIKSGNPIGTKMFEEGLFHVQDAASQLCSLAAAALAKDTILDMCAAPGGKTFTMAQKDGVYVTSCDLYPSRVKMLQQGAERLGLLSNVCIHLQDALQNTGDSQQYSLVLCDAPCSGLGVIRRKPEIKYKQPETILSLPQTQKAFLDKAAERVQHNGILIYSTCTLRQAENLDVVQTFLDDHKEFCLQQLPEFVWEFCMNLSGTATLFPNRLNCDGFFFAALRKEKNDEQN